MADHQASQGYHSYGSFSIIEEFAKLSSNRKRQLCHAALNGDTPFETAVRLLWPQSDATDIKKLKNFITLLNYSAAT